MQDLSGVATVITKVASNFGYGLIGLLALALFLLGVLVIWPLLSPSSASIAANGRKDILKFADLLLHRKPKKRKK